MGRGRPAAKDGGTKAKTATEKASRTTRGLRKSYVEDEGSETEDFKEDIPSSPEQNEEDSGSEYGGESSGSEYGKKKKKGKVSPKKAPAKRGRKPAGKAQLSPKKPGRPPGRKPKAAASSNGKRKRAAESSEEEEEEKISSEEVSGDEASGSGDTSGSEYGKKKASKKLKKEKPPTRSQPKRQAATSPKKRGRKPKEATNGSKKLKLSEELEKSEEDMEVEEPEKEKSEDEEGASAEDEVKESEAVAEKKTTKVDDKVEDQEEKTDEPDSPKSEEEEDDKSGSEEEEEKTEKTTKKEKPSSTTTDKGKSEPMNRTDTDFGSLDVGCEKKTASGEGWNFKIACWNVAGVKAWVKKRGLEYLKIEDPDVMCLQEIKCSEKTKPAEVKTIPNYPHTYWAFNEEANGHNGVATFCKVKPENVTHGFPIGDDDSEEDKKFMRTFNKEGRLLVTEFEKFYLFNAYVPNGGRGSKEQPGGKPYPPRVLNGERQAWDRLFRDYVKSLDEKKPVVVTGDLNVAHEPIDLANPKTNGNTAGFTKEERDGFTEMLSSTKLVDTFRSLYPEEKGYTFWSYIANARQKNVGWRLDYFLLSDKLRESLCESLMRKDVFGSDHCPIVLYVHF